MENKKSNFGSVIFITIIGAIGLIILFNQALQEKDYNSFLNYIDNKSYIDITTPQGTIKAEVSTSSSALELGLGERTGLGEDKGMLFVFPNEDKQGFWMKDMRFALDIIWLDKNKKVVTILKGLTPSTYPNIYFPISNSKYVLEINAFASEKYRIATGTTLTFAQ